jgi:toxin FitB
MFPVTKAVADRWAVLSAQTQHQGLTLATIDGLIAATAIEYDKTLVTRNMKHFSGVAVPLFNPWEP